MSAAFFHGRRDRRLMALLVLAIVSIGLASGAVYYRAAVLAPRYQPMKVFSGLARQLTRGDVTRVYIVSKKFGAFTVAFVPQKGWVLPDKGNYPASFEMVKQTLLGIAAMQTIEPKTDRPEWFHYVDLDPPPQGDGINVTLSGDRGHVIASMIVGKSEPLGDDLGLFVRRAGENQSYLVRSPTEIKADPAEWMDKTVISVAASRIASAEVKPVTGPAYTASRAKPEDGFAVAPLPKGRELAYSGAADATANALSDFGFDDIRRSTDFDFADGARLVIHTFDGLSVTVNLVTRDNATWARLFAGAEPGSQTAAKEALAINARAEGWAFKIPAYKATAFTPPLEGLLKAKGK
jgi:hypothetical protein